MTRMTGPDCVVMCNLINTSYIHTNIHAYIHKWEENTHEHILIQADVKNCILTQADAKNPDRGLSVGIAYIEQGERIMELGFSMELITYSAFIQYCRVILSRYSRTLLLLVFNLTFYWSSI